MGHSTTEDESITRLRAVVEAKFPDLDAYSVDQFTAQLMRIIADNLASGANIAFIKQDGDGAIGISEFSFGTDGETNSLVAKFFNP